MTKRPIVLVTRSLRRSQGGAEIYMANFSRYIARQGHPVRVLVRQASDEPVEGMEVEVVPEGGFAGEVERRVAGTGAVALSTLPLPGGITHYQPHNELFRDAFAAGVESYDGRLQQGLHAIGNLLNFKRQRMMRQQESLLRAESGVRVMTFSQRVRGNILKRHGISADRVTTIPLGVDLGRHRPDVEPSTVVRKSSPENLALLFVAHNFRLKGLHCLLRAFAEALKRGLKAELWIAGNNRGDQFRELAKTLGLGERAKFLGMVGDSELPGLYRSCDALVHPTFSDHCSLVVLEALASGRPVITTRQNGASEFIEHGKQGFVIRHPREYEALIKALMQLQDRGRLGEMSKAAAALRPRLDFEEHARKVLEWLVAER